MFEPRQSFTESILGTREQLYLTYEDRTDESENEESWLGEVGKHRSEFLLILAFVLRHRLTGGPFLIF